MALLTDFDLKRGDTREPIIAICQDATGAAVNLTGASAKFMMADHTGAVKVNATATIVDAANGIIKYQWITPDTDTVGDYVAEFQLTFGDGRILTFPNTTYITVHIIKDVAS